MRRCARTVSTSHALIVQKLRTLSPEGDRQSAEAGEDQGHWGSVIRPKAGSSQTGRMSRFVSAGAINAETGEAVEATAADKKAEGAAAEPKKNTEWEAVQKELEAERKRREEARVKAVEGGEKSLYDILQANKGES